MQLLFKRSGRFPARLLVTETLFEIRSSRLADALVVEVVGEVDMATAPKLGQAINSVLSGTSRVVVDLSSVTFLDSTALNALVQCQRELAEREIVFAVVSPKDRVVRSVFKITHLTESLRVADSLDAALAS